MRKIAFVLGVFGLSLWALHASAQQGMWSGSMPRKINFKPIDTTRAMKQVSAIKAFPDAPAPKPFSLNKLLPRAFTLGSWPPKTPNVFVLDSKNNPFQPTKPKGLYPFEPPAKKK